MNINTLYNGEWTGEIESSDGQGGPSQQFSVAILQRWSKMTITLETEHSRSHTITASLRIDGLPNPELSYLYINEPKAVAPDTMHMYRGTAVLEVRGPVLEGDYYTGRGRRTVGTLKMKRLN